MILIMKILGNFDTKLDEIELSEAIKKYGEGNAILTKKHWIFLMAPLSLLVLSIGAFALLVYLSYYQYYLSHPLVFWMVCSLQFAVTLFWIVHSIQMILHAVRKHRGKVFFSKIDIKDLKP